MAGAYPGHSLQVLTLIILVIFQHGGGLGGGGGGKFSKFRAVDY